MAQNTDTAQTPSWRDYSDQLPAHLIASYKRTEQLACTDLHLAFPDEDPAETLRQLRESMAEEARAQVPFAHVPLPGGAESADAWGDDDAGNWNRVVNGTHRRLDAEIVEASRRKRASLGVFITGLQTPDGSVRWGLIVSADDDPVGPEAVRNFAALLMDAADELDRLQ